MQPTIAFPRHRPVEDGPCPRCASRHYPGYSCSDPAAEGERAARAEVRRASRPTISDRLGSLRAAGALALEAANRDAEYIHLAGLEGEAADPYTQIGEVLRELLAEADFLRCHKHDWNSEDYCSICGADGAA